MFSWNAGDGGNGWRYVVDVQLLSDVVVAAEGSTANDVDSVSEDE